MPFLSGYWETVLTITSLQIIAALGLYILMSTGQMSLAQSAFMAIGAYASGILGVKLGLPVPVAFLGGIAAAVLVGFLIGYIFLSLDRWFFAVATMSLTIALVATLNVISYVGGAEGLIGFPSVTKPWMVIGLLVVLIGLFIWYTNSPLDLAFRAVRDEPAAAEALGISASRVRVVSFAIGAFLAGLAGILQAHFLTLARPGEFGFDMSFVLLIFIAVGGTENFLGTVFGGLLLNIVAEELRFSGTARLILYGSVLVVVILLRPKGLLGRWNVGMSPMEALRTMVGYVPRSRRRRSNEGTVGRHQGS